MISETPWHFNTDLTQERLIALANFIATVRAEVIDLHDEEMGDTRLSLGIRAYECSRTRINRQSESERFPWLHKVTPDGRFTFAIGSTPVRYTRNDAEDLPDRKLIVSQDAQWQMSLLEAEVQQYNNIRWFFVFDTQFDSAADAVFFVGYTEHGEIICQWEVPIENTPTILSVVEANSPTPVELPKPKIGIKPPPKEVPVENGKKDDSLKEH